MIFNLFPLTVQRWPKEIEFLNKEIPDYHLMKTFFGGLEGVKRNDDMADSIRRWIARGWPELEVIYVLHPASYNHESCKHKSSGSSKADEASDEDFTPRSRQQFKRKPKSSGSSKDIVEENSDDDFM